jgi:hypothetical protein
MKRCALLGLVALGSMLLPTVTNVGYSRAALRELRHPQAYALFWYMSCLSPVYFECDDATKTCIRGRGYRSRFAGLLLAEDRKTVLAHVAFIGGHILFNFDTGQVWSHDKEIAGLMPSEERARQGVDNLRSRKINCDPPPME